MMEEKWLITLLGRDEQRKRRQSLNSNRPPS